MNKAQMKKLEWQQILIRPIARRVDHMTGQELAPIDDRWLVSDVDPKLGVFINNTRTDHGMRIGFDHLREFMTDPNGRTAGIVLFKSQTFLSGNNMWLDPIL